MHLGHLVARVMSLVGRGQVKLTDTTDPQVQRVQVDHSRHLGLVDQLPLFQQFGFASRPPAGCDALVLFTNGDLADGTVVATNHQAHRPPALQEGDAALHDVRGVYLWLTAAGPVLDAGGLAVKVQNTKSVEITATDHVTVTAPTVTVSASTTVKLDTPVVEATHALKVDACPSGTVTSREGRVLTFANGVLTNLV